MTYSPVYSTPFVQYTPDTPIDSYEVPEGFTAIIRQVSVTQEAGAYSFAVYIQDSAEAPALIVSSGEGTGLYNNARDTGRWVVPAGGIITIAVSALFGSLNMYVGGYLLQNVIA